jgi:integrase
VVRILGIVEAPPTRGQAEQLVAADTTPAVWRVRYLLGLLQGLRDGEASGLRWGDVGEGDGIPVLAIKRAVSYHGREGGAQVSKVKTETSERTIPVHDLVARELAWWRETGWERWVGRAPKDSDYVLPDLDGGAWRPKSAQYLKDHLGAAELPTKNLEGFPHTHHGLGGSSPRPSRRRRSATPSSSSSSATRGRASPSATTRGPSWAR